MPKEIVECNHVKLLKCYNFAKYVVGSFDFVIDRFEVLAVDYLVFVSDAVVTEYAVEVELFVVAADSAVIVVVVVELAVEQLVGQYFSDLDLKNRQIYHYV